MAGKITINGVEFDHIHRVEILKVPGIDYDFERHHISSNNDDRGIPAEWVYLIKPPDDCIGGLDLELTRERALIDKALAEGFIRVSPNLYDEFLRSRKIKAFRISNEVGEIHMQDRYTFQHLRVATLQIGEGALTWGEWEEYEPTCIGYPPRYFSDEPWETQAAQYWEDFKKRHEARLAAITEAK